MTAEDAHPVTRPTPLDGLGQLLPRLAERWPGRTALVTAGRSLTYPELDELAGRVAHGLTRLGVQPGDRVALLSQNRWEWIAATTACCAAAPSSTPST